MSGTYSGSYTTWCNNHPNGCPPGAVHTLNYRVNFPHSISGINGTAQGTPTQTLNASSWDSTANCDLLFGTPGIPDCRPSRAGTAVCSIMGTVGGISAAPIQFEEAFIRERWTGGGGTGCYHATSSVKSPLVCAYPVVSHCTAATTPPDFRPVYMLDLCASRDGFGQCLPPVGFGWDASAPCWRFGTSGPWTCWPGGISIMGDLDDPNTAPADCTHNP